MSIRLALDSDLPAWLDTGHAGLALVKEGRQMPGAADSLLLGSS